MRRWARRSMRSMEWRSTLSADLFPDPGAPASGMRAGGSIVSEGAVCQLRDLGRIGFTEAYVLQQDFVARRKRGEIPDQFLIVEHPHVVTMGRNGRPENLLAPPELLARAGIAFHHTDRGGDVTYHGPGQIVVYPIFDLRGWKRDVIAYVRGLEDVIIDVLGQYGMVGDRLAGATGVWVRTNYADAAKVAAIGVHVSRWVTSHGFALNLDTDLQ